MADLSGKRVLIIGGETKLGRAIVVGLAERGADVAICSLTPDTKAEFAINSALNELWAIGRKGHALAIDASDADRVRSAVARFEQELGRLDLAIVTVDSVAIDALVGALPGRNLEEVDLETPPDVAVARIASRLE
jgi:NAD(P)-dependent dehydrogenase (short-subunit alcohol dehydrogenase family)